MRSRPATSASAAPPRRRSAPSASGARPCWRRWAQPAPAPTRRSGARPRVRSGSSGPSSARYGSAGRCGCVPVAARPGALEREPARRDVHHQPLAVADLPCDDLLRQRRLDRALDDALERPGAVDRVEPTLGEEVLGPVGEYELERAVREPGLEAGELDVDDLPQARAAKRVEEHHW